jgi:RNA polymerase sigma-70 factor (ECF subfamily)
MLTRTTTALLDDLADPANQAIWQEFDARYRPILIGFGLRLGLDPTDAADAAQEALGRFVRSYRAGKYERGRGRLSSWIIGIARNCILDTQRARAARREQHSMSAVEDLPGPDRLAEIWTAERDREILRRAIAALRGETRFDARTVGAFEELAFRQQPPAEVAEQLGMSMNDVYLAKHRCLKRLRTLVTELSSAFEQDQ